MNEHERVAAFGNQLVEVHVWLRERLEDLRDNIDDYFDGAGVPAVDLRAHCLTFCQALTRHHAGEDGGAFAVVEDASPQLRDVIAQLRTDHNQIDWLLRRVERLVAELPEKPDATRAAAVQSELDGLSAVMETHFRYEEKKIVDLLNRMDMPQWRERPPDFLRIDEPEPGPSIMS